jgi:hypothetical protein
MQTYRQGGPPRHAYEHSEPIPPWASGHRPAEFLDYNHIYPPDHRPPSYPRDHRYPSSSQYGYDPPRDPRSYNAGRMPDGRADPRLWQRDAMYDRPSTTGADPLRRSASASQYRPDLQRQPSRQTLDDRDPFGLEQPGSYGASLPPQSQQHARSRSASAAFERPRTFSNISNSSLPFDIGSGPSPSGGYQHHPQQRPEQYRGTQQQHGFAPQQDPRHRVPSFLTQIRPLTQMHNYPSNQAGQSAGPPRHAPPNQQAFPNQSMSR